MTFPRFIVFLFAALGVVACQTVPINDSDARPFASSASRENGMIRITGFHIPKDEPGTTLLLLMAAAGGANINYPVSASVFDITNERTRYIGTLAVYGMGRWLETEVPAGRRTLMLSLAGRESSIFAEAFPTHSDFLDIDVKPGGITHVVLSRYGFSRYPYLGEIAIQDAHRDHCLGVSGKHKERLQAIEQYMAANTINEHARDFKNFCFLLSNAKYIQTPNAEAHKQFSEQSARIEAFRKEGYDKWTAEGERRLPYDLMRSYEPSKPLEP